MPKIGSRMLYNEAYIVYKLLNINRVGPVTTSKIIRNVGLTELCESDSTSNLKITLQDHLNSDQIDDFLEEKDNITNQIERILKKNGGFLNLEANDYPNNLKFSLKKKAPPILSYLGNSDLLSNPSVGFCGSRKASQKGLSVAYDCSEQFSNHNIVVVSGYATGVDLETHYSSLKNGGKTIIVLPYGLEEFKIRKKLEDVWDWNRVLVISEFVPNAIWTASRAMKRNNTIIGLSDAMVLIESSKKGGSMDAGKKTLKLNKRLYAPVYKDMPDFAIGNQILIKKGAIPIMKSRKTSRANISKILKNILNNKPSNQQLDFKENND